MPRVRSRAAVIQLTFHPKLEALEDRFLPAMATWTGASPVDSNWSTAQNWQGNVAPSPFDDLVFPAGAAQQTNVDDFSAGTTFNSITLSGGTSDSYFLDGNNNLVLLAGIIDKGTNTNSNVINISQLTLGASQQFTFQNSASNLKINSPVDLQSFTLTLNSTISFGTFQTAGELRGLINGTGGTNGAIIKTGIGGWELSHDNAYMGSTTISQGVLSITTGNGLGDPSSQTLVQAGGGLVLRPDTNNISVPNPITINGTGAGDPEPGAILVYHAFAIPILTGTLTLGSASEIFTANDPMFVPKFEISGTVNTQGFDLTLGGNLITILPSSCSITGGGKVIQDAQLLTGACTINTPVTIDQGALSPGIPSSAGTTPAVLNTGILTLSSGTAFMETINGATAGTSYSQVVVNGAINLASANLNTNLGFTPVAGTSFVMMECTGSVTGTFNGLADGATLTINSLPFLIHYVNSPTTAGNVGPNTFMGRVVLASTPLNTVAGVSASQNPAQSGQGVTITAGVVGVINAPAAQGGVGPLGGANLPAVGSVQFMDGGSPLGNPVTLTSGLGSITPPLTPGVHSITAVFTPSNGNFSPTTSPAYVLTVNSTGWHDVVTGDFLGNGKQDIAGMTASGQWWLAQSTGSGFTNQLWGNWNPNVTWVDVQVGDFDGDGKMDIAGRFLQTGQWWVAVSNGSSFTNQLWTTWNPNVTWVDVKVGDFNGDGKADLVGRFLQTGQWFVAQSTSSSFNNSLWTTWNPNVTWVDVHVGNFAGNKTSDLTGRYLQGGSWWTAMSNGSSFSTGLWAQWNPNVTWVDVKVGDFDNNGKTDLTARWLEGGSWWTALSTGSSFNTTMWAQWNPNVTWVDVQVGDFNGDGKADIVARFSQAGSWWAGISTGSSFATANWDTWSPLANWVDVSAAEVDGDKFTDLVGRFGATGQWWVAISNGSTAFSNQLWTTWAP
jgi:autotransporter-associated beta strand protein